MYPDQDIDYADTARPGAECQTQPEPPYQDSVSFSFRAFAKLILLMPVYLLWLLGIIFWILGEKACLFFRRKVWHGGASQVRKRQAMDPDQ